jgi:hypothetical protein
MSVYIFNHDSICNMPMEDNIRMSKTVIIKAVDDKLKRDKGWNSRFFDTRDHSKFSIHFSAPSLFNYPKYSSQIGLMQLSSSGNIIEVILWSRKFIPLIYVNFFDPKFRCCPSICNSWNLDERSEIYLKYLAANMICPFMHCWLLKFFLRLLDLGFFPDVLTWGLWNKFF